MFFLGMDRGSRTRCSSTQKKVPLRPLKRDVTMTTNCSAFDVTRSEGPGSRRVAKHFDFGGKSGVTRGIFYAVRWRRQAP